MTPRFVLAKYVPDLNRMEPRNIGVFVWWRGEVRMRFLETDHADFVNDLEVYRRWLSFWQNRIASDTIAPARGKPVSTQEPACMDALISTQKGQYLLIDSGELLNPIHKKEIAAVVDYLFDDLVAPHDQAMSKKESSTGFQTQCDALFERTGVSSRPDFHRSYKIGVGVFQVLRHFNFNYCIAENGHPLALFHRVSLHKEMSVNSAALMLHAATNNALVSRGNCGALIRASDMISDSAEESYALLDNICTIVDIDQSDAMDTLQQCIPSTIAE